MWRTLLLALCLSFCGGNFFLYAQMEGDLVYFQPVSCPGGADGEVIIEGIGGQGPYMFSIDGCNTFVAPGIFTGLAVGSYTICILDIQGDTGFFQLNMTEPLPLEVEVVSERVVPCFGENTGALTLGGIGGTAPYEFRLDGGLLNTDPTFTDLSAGVYTVQVRDANGCLSTQQAGVSQAAPLQLIIDERTPTSCEGGNTGGLSLRADGGQGSITFQLNGGAVQQQGEFGALAAGSYTLILEDDSACAAEFSLDVPAWSGWGLEVDAPQLLCSDIADGAISLDLQGAARPPFLYQIDAQPLQSLARFEGLATGTYDLRIQDVNGCDTTFQVTLESPEPLTYALDVASISCFGTADGEARVTPAGGIAPYSIFWDESDQAGEENNTNLNAGNHTVRIEDQNGCATTGGFFVAQPDVVELEALEILSARCGITEGQVRLQATGGTSPYQFSEATGQGRVEGNLVTELNAGDNLLRVTDANGCETEIRVNVPETEGVEAGFYSVPDLNAPLSLESSELRIFNTSTGATSYVWDFGDGARATDAEPVHAYTQAGTYTLLLVASNPDGSCVDSLTRTVAVVGGEELFFIPNVFSPNGDGYNDLFKVIGQSVIRAEMTVFDRTGRKVAYAEVFENGWDGRDLFRKPLPVGSYAYSMRVVLSGGEAIQQGGGFTLVR